MDELTAYKILRLEAGSSREEIRKAYADLSKEFHPEEAPEEFQRIHDAYVTLTRGNHRGYSAAQEEGPERCEKPRQNSEFDFSQVQEEEQEKREKPRQNSEFDFSKVRKEEPAQREETQKEPEFDFDSALNQAERKEEARLHEITLQAIAEMRVLLSPQYQNKLKFFRTFFKKKEYQEVLKTPEFLAELANLLAYCDLKKSIYNYMISYYRLRGLAREQLIEEARALYDVLDKKHGIQKKNNIGLKVVPVSIAAVIWAESRPKERKVPGSSDIGMAAGVIILAILVYLFYRKLYENHSQAFAVFIVSLTTGVLHFFAVMTDFYAPFMGVDSGITFSAMVIVLSLVMMAVSVVMAFIQKIKNKRS